jgi:dienelactone hydrolase
MDKSQIWLVATVVFSDLLPLFIRGRAMTSILNLGLSLVAMLAMQPAFGHHVELPQGMTQAQATWLWGHHSIPADITLSGTAYWYVYPHTDVNAITNPVWSDVAAKHIKPGAKAPAVLVMHGCSGLSYGDREYRSYFINSGYVVFEPNSFARPGREPCTEDSWDESYRMRVEELEQALIEIRKLAWVDQDHLFLMGISEGGAVAAGWSKNEFAGHIILEASCWSQKDRIPAAPLNTPVLAAIGEKDLWAKGASCNTKTHARGSNSVVVKDAPHGMSDRPEVGKAVDDFIKAVTGS